MLTGSYAARRSPLGGPPWGVGESPERTSEAEYLQTVERLAREVTARASDEGWLRYGPDDGDQSPLQQAVNELARSIRHVHYEGDGCLDESDDDGA